MSNLLDLPPCPVVPALTMLERDYAPVAFSACWDKTAGVAYSDAIGDDGPAYVVAVWRWDEPGYLATTVRGRSALAAIIEHIDPDRRLPSLRGAR